MKKFCFFILFLFVFSVLKSEEVNGILVKKNGDTIHQIIKVDGKDLEKYLVNNNLVERLRDFDGRKISYKKYTYISFRTLRDSFAFYAIKISENDWDESSTEKPVFYRLLNNKNAIAKLYEFYDVSDKIGMMLAFGIYVYKKQYKSYLVEKNGNYTVVTQNGFKSYVKDVFKDDKELVQKIKDEIYNFKDMPAIIDEYNVWYDTK